MSKPNKRTVRMQQFQKQIAEQVLPEDNLVAVELDDAGTTVHIKVPVALASDDPYQERMKSASSEEDVCLVILGFAPDKTAEEQWKTWTKAGYTAVDLIKVWNTETGAAQERLSSFRYKG